MVKAEPILKEGEKFIKRKKNKPRFKLRSQEQMQAELTNITDEQERLKWFEQVVKDFDHADYLNEWKHTREDRHHWFDIDLLERDSEEEISIPSIFKTLNTDEGWLDCIFSRKPDDLHELVEDEAISKALRDLNSKRREALFYRVVHRYSAEEIAAFKGVSDRSVRKLYEKAIQEVRERLDKQDKSN